MSALYNGQQYLIEQYAIVPSPSLQLFDPKPLYTDNLSALAAGLDQARQGFSSLPHVGNELAQIQSEVRSQVLLNQQFTTQAFQTEIDSQPFSIVHLATHGDQRAVLGLAGVAIRAGARSTIASLWSVNDESTALLMNQFYQELINQALPKAEALRHAQLALLNTPEYQLPIFWAPYVLIGSWL